MKRKSYRIFFSNPKQHPLLKKQKKIQLTDSKPIRRITQPTQKHSLISCQNPSRANINKGPPLLQSAITQRPVKPLTKKKVFSISIEKNKRYGHIQFPARFPGFPAHSNFPPVFQDFSLISLKNSIKGPPLLPFFQADFHLVIWLGVDRKPFFTSFFTFFKKKLQVNLRHFYT